MASNNEGYWSKSYGLLTRDQGWFKPLLVLAAARMVPIVGPFGADGYALEWARLTSWGVDSSPKQKNVDIGACIGSGARAFVVALGYGLVIALVSLVFRTIFGVALGGIFNILLGAVCGVFVTIAKLRATIYQTIGAGYQFNRIRDMVKRDSNGVLHIIGLSLILGLIVGLVATVLFGIVLAANFASAIGALIEYEMYDYIDEYHVASMFLSSFARSLPSVMVLSYLMMIATSFTNLIITTAVGLWLRQFDVRNWGQSSDPLPSDNSGYSAGTVGYQQSVDTSDGEYGAPAADTAAHQEPVSPASEQQAIYDYQPMPIPVPTSSSPDVVSTTNEPTVQVETEGSVAPTRTFSLEDAAEDEPVFLQPVAESEPVMVEPEPVADSEPVANEPEVFSLEKVVESVVGPKSETAVNPERELTTDEVLEQAEAAIRKSDMTLPEEEPAAPEAPHTFSLDDAVLDQADEEAVAETEVAFEDDPEYVSEDEDEDEDVERPTSDEVITKVIPLGGADTEQAQ